MNLWVPTVRKFRDSCRPRVLYLGPSTQLRRILLLTRSYASVLYNWPQSGCAMDLSEWSLPFNECLQDPDRNFIYLCLFFVCLSFVLALYTGTIIEQVTESYNGIITKLRTTKHHFRKADWKSQLWLLVQQDQLISLESPKRSTLEVR